MRMPLKQRPSLQPESLESRTLMSVNLTIDANQQYQTMVGFGSSVYSAATTAPYDAPANSAPYQNFLNDYVNDLGLTMVRFNFNADVLPTQPAVPLGADLSTNIAALNFNSA